MADGRSIQVLRHALIAAYPGVASRSCRGGLLWALLLYVLHLFCVWWWAWTHAPNGNEWGHLAAGLNYLSRGRHDLYVVNPPLTRLLAGVGGRLGKLELVRYGTHATSDASGDGQPPRPEFGAGEWLRDTYGTRAWLALRYARTLLAIVAATGVLGLYCAGRALGRPEVGLGAALLWATSPTMLSWCGTLNADATAAAAVTWLSAAIVFDVRRQRATSAALVGLALGVGCITKFALLVCVPAALLTVACSRLRAGARPGRWRRVACHPALAALIAYVVVLAAYGTLPNVRTLASGRYYSEFFSRLATGPLARFPLFVPGEMIAGLDIQQYDLERPRPTYVAGLRYEDRVWWYYLYCWLVKEPPAAVVSALMGVALVAVCCAKRRPEGWLILSAMLPGLAVWLIISAHGQFTTFYRYAYPGLPALWLAGGFALATFRAGGAALRGIHWLIVGSALTSAATTAPHWTSYFSEAVGGPWAGARHLSGQCLDWGQDIPALAVWARDHQGSWPLYVATPLTDPLSLYGLPQARPLNVSTATRLPPGWYAVSVTRLLEAPERYARLIELGPVTHIGYSICVFFVPDADREPRRQVSKAGAFEAKFVKHHCGPNEV